MLNEISDLHLNHIKLWYLVQHSLSSFQKVIQYFGSADLAVQAANLARWSELSIHQNHIQRAKNLNSGLEKEKFASCLNQLRRCCDFILIDSDADYPKQLLPYTDRPPIIFGRGSYQNLSQPQVAIVGSRKASPHGKQVAYDFAYYLSEKGFFISSGLAQGIDEAAHLGALKNHRTIAIVGTGLDLIYPSQNKHLHDQILQSSGSIISEFLPGTKPLQHHFPRRNRIVSGLSLGVLVAEAKLKSGSLITAQAAANQGKITFAIPGHIYSEFNQGCHQLIREGAILVDHPEQIIEDLALPAQWQQNQNYKIKAEQTLNPSSHHLTSCNIQATTAQIKHDTQAKFSTQQAAIQDSAADPDTMSSDAADLAKPIQLSSKIALNIQAEIPTHLFKLYQQLDWVGQSLDDLVNSLDIQTAELTGILMELELAGLCIQQSGLYLRCRQSH